MDDLALPLPVGFPLTEPVGVRVGAGHPASPGWRAAGRRPVNSPLAGDLGERDTEHVQHEGQSLGRRQRLEHDEQCGADRVGEYGVPLGIRAIQECHAAQQRILAPRRTVMGADGNVVGLIQES